MDIFYITLYLVFMVAFLARITPSKKTGKASLFFTLIVMAIVILVAGLRTNIGDTYYYVHSYDTLGPENIKNGDYEIGFMILLSVLKSISKDPQFMIFITSLITGGLNIWTLRNYSKNNYFELIAFMYIASGYMLVTMNGIRQCLAASIIFACTPLLLKRKTIPYILMMIFASTFHSTSLVMIAVYFLCTLKPWSKYIAILGVLTLVLAVLYGPLMQILGAVNDKAAVYAISSEGGASILRVIIFAVPAFLAYLKKDSLKEQWPESDIFVNITLFSFLIMIFATIQWVFARFTLYLQPYTFILLPYIIRNCFNGKERRVVYLGFVLCYMLFYFIEVPANLNGTPYKTDFKISNYYYDTIRE